MENKPYYTNFQDEREEKISQKVFLRFVLIFFIVYVFIVGIAFAFHKNFSYITISGKSMQSTLNPNPVAVKTKRGVEYLQDGVYIKHTQNVDYGDIVVLDTTPNIPNDDSTIIKRVIGLEGDFVTIVKLEGKSGNREFHVLRIKSGTNDVEVLEEEYIYSYSEWSGTDGNAWEINVNGVIYESDLYEIYTKEYKYESTIFSVEELGGVDVVFFQVPEDSIFFLGDNRAHSNDSRGLGFYNLNRIEGKVVDIVRNGSDYKGNDFWWFNRMKGFFRVIWREILVFFGANS